MRAYGDKFLPAHHPVTQQVARVASRIITAANLGEVKGVSQSASSSMGGWSALPSSGTGEFGDDEWKDSSPSSPKKTASVVDRLRQEWEVHVIRDDDTPNAFVTGSELKYEAGGAMQLTFSVGGNIYVFTGILPVAQDDDGIATVLGHGKHLRRLRCIVQILNTGSKPIEIAHQGERASQTTLTATLNIPPVYPQFSAMSPRRCPE